MTTLLQRGFALLSRGMEAAAVETVRYTRGVNVVGEGVRALLSNQRVEQVTDGGAAIIGRQFTWQLNRDDLRLNGEAFKPLKSDRIEWELNGKTYVFLVMPEVASPEAPAVDPRSEWITAVAKLAEVI